jgi:hypothetical protein
MSLYVSEVIRRVPGYIPWSVDGDPCYDRWEGVICNLDETIIGIDFERRYKIMVPMMASVLEETIWMVSASMGISLNLKGTSRINVTACLHI